VKVVGREGAITLCLVGIVLVLARIVAGGHIVGVDPYYFLNFVCGNYDTISAPPFALLFFSATPCNELVIAAVFQLLWLLDNIILAASIGWGGAFFAFLNPLWIVEFWKFEDDHLALPLLFMSLKLWRENKKFKALCLVVLATLFWKGAATWVVFYAAQGYVPAILLSIPLLPPFVKSLIPVAAIHERRWGYALQLWGLGLIGLPTMPLEGWFWIIAGMLNTKWALFAVPYLAMGLFTSFKRGGMVKKVLLVMGVFATVGLVSVVVFEAIPTQNDIQAVELSILASTDGKVCGDWDVGYWVDYFGGNGTCYGGPGCECWEGSVLTYKNMTRAGNCTYVFGTGRKLYWCGGGG